METEEENPTEQSGDRPLPIVALPRKVKVLVVDDDPIHHKLFELIAARLNIDARLASSCHQATDAAKIENFELILMDAKMPQVDGCLCSKRIRELNEAAAKVPIIMISARGEFDSNQVEDASINDCLSKPFTLEELKQIMNRWLIDIQL